MRVLEMLWVAACVSMLIILLSRNTINRKAGAIVGIAGGSLFAVQLLVEGYRWQMIPAYIVTALLFVLVLFSADREETFTEQKTTNVSLSFRYGIRPRSLAKAPRKLRCFLRIRGSFTPICKHIPNIWAFPRPR